MANKQRLPLLLTSHGNESEYHTFYNLVQNQYKTRFLPFLTMNSVLCSAYGWLVLVDRLTCESFLWNPTPMEIIQLPELLVSLTPYNKCFLSKPPTEPDCFVVLNQFTVLYICKIGDDEFIEIYSEDKGYDILDMISFKGVTYALINPLDKLNYELVTIHIVGGALETRPLLIDGKLHWEIPRPIQSSTSSVNYLIESPCGNELLLVSEYLFFVHVNSCVHFRVFRVDVSKMECEELENHYGKMSHRHQFIDTGRFWQQCCCRSDDV